MSEQSPPDRWNRAPLPRFRRPCRLWRNAAESRASARRRWAGAPGSIGASADPARVFKGVKMPGRMGGKRVTQRGLEVVQVDAERNLLLIRGAVPGPKGGTVEVRSDG